MNELNPDDLYTIYSSFKDIEDRLISHKMTLDSLLEPRLSRASPSGTATGAYGYKARYKKMLMETINALEATRKSFKSKQIESLRKKLMAELADIE